MNKTAKITMSVIGISAVAFGIYSMTSHKEDTTTAPELDNIVLEDVLGTESTPTFEVVVDNADTSNQNSENPIPTASITVTEDGDVVTIDRTWGTRPESSSSSSDTTDTTSGNMGSSGTVIELDENDNYVEPNAVVNSTPTTTPVTEVVQSNTVVAPTTTTSGSPSTSTPQNGDTKTEDGQDYVYNNVFGWVKKNPAGGLIPSDTSSQAGTGEKIGY